MRPDPNHIVDLASAYHLGIFAALRARKAPTRWPPMNADKKNAFPGAKPGPN
jgi:hypothetical protein